jgi:hypothetical protein
MPTINTPVTGTWTLIVPSAATWFIASSDSPTIVEYASGANDSTAPTAAIGHRLRSGEGLTRALLPEGPLFARVAAKGSNKSAVVVVDADVVPT